MRVLVAVACCAVLVKGGPDAEPARALPPIILPLEVLGDAGTTRELCFDAGSSIPATGPAHIEARIYGLEYEEMGEVELNRSAPIVLRDANVDLEKNPKAWGGIGGAYSTLDLKIPVPTDALVPGVNSLRFRFRKTDGFALGFRVLKANVVVGGTPLIKPEAFRQDDPNTWRAPLPSDGDIAAGKTLWESAPLTLSPLQPAPMKAKCADCHAADGYDLKYFNFSNLSIIERSKFHGLSEPQGKQIASYIHALQAQKPGRPWNPPYQPGPGIDSKPVQEWAAGAGIDWVLKDDTEMLKYMYPGGVPRPQDLKANRNQRETPVAVELPSWNQWLPRVHPVDGWGDGFKKTPQWQTYQEYRNNARFNGSSGEKVGTWREFQVARPGQPWPKDLEPLVSGQGDAAVEEKARILYSYQQWLLVKRWEIARRFELEGLGDVYSTEKISWNPFPSTLSAATTVSNPRTWGTHNAAFNVAPHMCKLPREKNNSIRRGNAAMWDYFSLSWYHLQLVLTDNHRSGDGATHWPYTVAFTASRGSKGGGFPLLRFFTFEKFREAYFNNFALKEGPARSMVPGGLYVISRKHPLSKGVFNDLPNAIYLPLVEAQLRSWLDDCKARHTRAEYAAALPEQFDGGKYATIRSHHLLSFPQQLFDALTEWKSLGLNSKLLHEAADYGKLLWPADAAAWDGLKL